MPHNRREQAASPTTPVPFLRRIPVVKHAILAAERWFDRFFPVGAILCVEISDCNLACAMCPRGGPQPLLRAGKGLMSPEMFGRIIDKFLEENVRIGAIWFANWGEPLLNPAFPAMVRKARDNFRWAKLTAFTNLNALPDPGALLLSGLDDLQVSISGMSPETYDKNHRGGNVHNVLANLDRLAALKARLGRGPRLIMKFHKYIYNEGDIPAAKAFCRTRGIKFRPIRCYISSVEGCAAFAQDPDRYAGFYSAYIDLDRERALARKLNSPEHCVLKRYMVAVDTDGALFRCCGVYDDRNLMGSFFERRIREIGRGPSAICELCARTPISWR